MLNLQVSKWGNSLAVRIPADYVRQAGLKAGDHLQAGMGADGMMTMRPTKWSRQAFAQELTRNREKLPMGVSVMEQLHQEARY